MQQEPLNNYIATAPLPSTGWQPIKTKFLHNTFILKVHTKQLPQDLFMTWTRKVPLGKTSALNQLANTIVSFHILHKNQMPTTWRFTLGSWWKHHRQSHHQQPMSVTKLSEAKSLKIDRKRFGLTASRPHAGSISIQPRTLALYLRANAIQQHCQNNSYQKQQVMKYSDESV